MLDEFVGAFRVDLAPVAFGFAGSEANRVAGGVDGFAEAVDPAEAQGLVDGFVVGDAGFAGIFFVEAHIQFGLLGVVFGQPGAERSGGGEVGWLHGGVEYRLRGANRARAGRAKARPYSVPTERLWLCAGVRGAA